MLAVISLLIPAPLIQTQSLIHHNLRPHGHPHMQTLLTLEDSSLSIYTEIISHFHYSSVDFIIHKLRD